MAILAVINSPSIPIGKTGLILSLLGLAIVFRFVYVRWFSPLHKVPGPFLARFTALWEFYYVLRGVHQKKLTDLHRKYGPVVRVGPNRYSFTHVQDVKKIYAIGGKFPKSPYYSVVGDHGSGVFEERDPTVHADKRRKVSSLYAMSTVMSYEPAVNRTTSVFMDKMEGFVAQQGWVSIPEIMTFYAFDVIGEITVGHSFNMLEREKDFENIIKLIGLGSTIDMACLGLFQWFHPILAKARSMLGSGSSGFILEKIIRNQVEMHRGEGLQGKADPRAESFVAKLVQLEEDKKITFENVMDSCTSNYIAGADTTGIVFSAALYNIYKNPQVLAELRKEIEDKEAEGEVTDPITFHEAQKLPLLQAVIKETLRLHPAIPIILPRNVPREGTELAGHYFPPGSEVGTNPWAVHRNPQVFAPDPDTFRPQRWINTPDHANEMMNASFMPFGGGSRSCIGKNISMLELSKVIPQIVRNFDFEFEHPELALQTYATFFAWPHYKCRISRRVVPSMPVVEKQEKM